MKQWKYLQEGDIVDVIAPSSYCSKEEVRAGIYYLESLGLQVRYPKNLVRPDFVYANKKEVTLKHLKYAFYNNDSKAIWCLRGGSGTFRFLPEFMKWKQPKKTKIFVGISDTTFLHLFLNQKWNWPTLHAPMISMLGSRKSSLQERRDLEKVIFGKIEKNVFSNITPMNSAAEKKTSLHAPLIGGNLCIVESTLGTPYAPHFAGKLIFLEDIDERGYAIERTLEHLRNARTFENVRAIIFGDFVGGHERDGRSLTMKALKRFAISSKFPVYRGIRSGHGSLVRTLPLNTPSSLKLTKKNNFQLICQTGGSF